MGYSSVTGDETIYFCDNLSFDGTPRGGKLTADFQGWFGQTASPHVKKRTFRSSSNTITLGYSTDTGVDYFDLDVDLANVPDLHSYRYIVSAGGAANGANYTTIQDAVTAALSTNENQDIWLQDEMFIENISIPAGSPRLNFIASPTSYFNTGQTLWAGKVTTSGSLVGFSGLYLQNSSDYFLDQTDTGESASGAFFENCHLQTFDNDFMNAQGSFGITLNNCTTGFTDTTKKLWANNNGNIVINNHRIDTSGGTLTPSTSSGTVNVLIQNSILNFPITKSSTGIFQCYNSSFKFGTVSGYAKALTISGGTDNTIENCYFSTGDQTCLTVDATTKVCNCSFSTSATNAIDGSGTLIRANLSFESSSNIATTTQTALVSSSDLAFTKSPGAYPYTVLTEDEFIFADSSSAHTVNLPSSPSLGQRHTVIDVTGTANTNNITVSGNGNNIIGSSTFTINLAYGAVSFIYNGTQWSAF